MLTQRDLQYRKNLLRLIRGCETGHTGGDLFSCIDILNVHAGKIRYGHSPDRRTRRR
jgi:hypothetical protein